MFLPPFIPNNGKYFISFQLSLEVNKTIPEKVLKINQARKQMEKLFSKQYNDMKI